MKIGILGGTFDPPHVGHLNISLEAIKRFQLNKVIWLITKKNPLKKKSASNDISNRIKLCNELIKKNNWWTESLDEAIKKAEEQQTNGTISSYRLGEFKKTLKKAMRIDQELPKEVDDFLTGLQNRTLGVLPVKVYDIMGYN